MPGIPLVLVPLDGSDRSMRTVDYLSQVLSPANVGIELFHVLPEAPDSFFDSGEIGEATAYETEMGQWKSRHRLHMDQCMDKARKIFLEAGFPSGNLGVSIQACKVGIARDIIARAGIGCAAVAIARNSKGNLPEFMMGSVAAKLAEVIVTMPLLIVGGMPEPRKFLVGVDRSAFVRKGLSLLIPLLSRELDTIWLCHIVRPMSGPPPSWQSSFSRSNETDWMQANERRILPSLANAEQRLARAGFEPGTLRTVVVKDKISRAEGIYAQALAFGAGTIVVGRRGTTLVEDFTMGRVSRKVLHMAYDRAVWIV